MATKLPKYPKGTLLIVGQHRVEVDQYLSEGGFAQIYSCRISPIEQGTEIACLKRVIVPDKSGLTQLRAEVDVMQRLSRCSEVVKYYDSQACRIPHTTTYEVLVLMELCPNKSLLDFMNARLKTKLMEPEILKIMYDVSRAIYYMHGMKLIHRDIKIENVLIDANHRFKLADFGSACPPLRSPKTFQEFQLLHNDILHQTTPQYRAPEMIDLYQLKPIDEKSDIWALGIFLYKLCYYFTPFEHIGGEFAILHACYQFSQQPIYSQKLLSLIAGMLQVDAAARPNIYQVVVEVAKQMNISKEEIGLEDIYGQGDFHFSLDLKPKSLFPEQQQPMIFQEDLNKMQKEGYYQRQYVPSNVQTPQPTSHLLRIPSRSEGTSDIEDERPESPSQSQMQTPQTTQAPHVSHTLQAPQISQAPLVPQQMPLSEPQAPLYTAPVSDQWSSQIHAVQHSQSEPVRVHTPVSTLDPAASVPPRATSPHLQPPQIEIEQDSPTLGYPESPSLAATKFPEILLSPSTSPMVRPTIVQANFTGEIENLSSASRPSSPAPEQHSRNPFPVDENHLSSTGDVTADLIDLDDDEKEAVATKPKRDISHEDLTKMVEETIEGDS